MMQITTDQILMAIQIQIMDEWIESRYSEPGSGYFVHKNIEHEQVFIKTRAKQAQACNTAPCLHISDIVT